MKIFWVIDPLCIWRSLLLEFIDLLSHTLFGHTSKDFFSDFFQNGDEEEEHNTVIIDKILVAFLKILWTNVKNLISRLIVKFQRGWSLLKSYWSEKSGLLNYKYIGITQLILLFKICSFVMEDLNLQFVEVLVNKIKPIIAGWGSFQYFMYQK